MFSHQNSLKLFYDQQRKVILIEEKPDFCLFFCANQPDYSTKYDLYKASTTMYMHQESNAFSAEKQGFVLQTPRTSSSYDVANYMNRRMNLRYVNNIQSSNQSTISQLSNNTTPKSNRSIMSLYQECKFFCCSSQILTQNDLYRFKKGLIILTFLGLMEIMGPILVLFKSPNFWDIVPCTCIFMAGASVIWTCINLFIAIHKPEFELDDLFLSEHVTCKRRFVALILSIGGLWTFWSVYGTYGIALTIGTVVYLMGVIIGMAFKMIGVSVKVFAVVIATTAKLIPGFLKIEFIQSVYQLSVGVFCGIAHVISGLASAFSMVL